MKSEDWLTKRLISAKNSYLSISRVPSSHFVTVVDGKLSIFGYTELIPNEIYPIHHIAVCTFFGITIIFTTSIVAMNR